METFLTIYGISIITRLALTVYSVGSHLNKEKAMNFIRLLFLLTSVIFSYESYAEEIPAKTSPVAMSPAAQRLTISAERGDAIAQFKLGILYSNGDGNNQPDYALAFKWLLSAAEQGIAEAQYNVGVLYFKGLGTQKNIDESIAWLKKAADKNDTESQRLLAKFYMTGGEFPSDRLEGLRLWRRLASKGNAKDMYMLGLALETTGVDADEKKLAIQWYRKSAWKSNLHGQIKTAILQYLGEGGEGTNKFTALWWFHAALSSASGETDKEKLDKALLLVDQLYPNISTPPKAEAVNWFSQAAANGFAEEKPDNESKAFGDVKSSDMLSEAYKDKKK